MVIIYISILHIKRSKSPSVVAGHVTASHPNHLGGAAGRNRKHIFLLLVCSGSSSQNSSEKDTPFSPHPLDSVALEMADVTVV
ncbi:hypothetical protein JTE90_027328 [Oedothorax gibbosus]|uniref:Uncharacterized protein n=1 Tax=Oedothorax gibbosus TaxID=931172 RepID=A0AAV6W144_9ARAC|nr:hypothetical protein JTE90_027328 [Oedothorax gibbosus]